MSGFSRGILALAVLVALGHAGCSKRRSKPSAGETAKASPKAAVEPAGKLRKTDPPQNKLIAAQEDPAERAGPTHVLATYEQEEPSRFEPHFSTLNSRASRWPAGRQPNLLRGDTKQVLAESKRVSSRRNVLRSGKRWKSSSGSSEPRGIRVEDEPSPLTDRKPIVLTPHFSRVFPFRPSGSEEVVRTYNPLIPARSPPGFGHVIVQSKGSGARSILVREQRVKNYRASFPLPKCQVKAFVRLENEHAMVVFEVDGLGTYIVHEGSTIILSNKKPLRVLKIRKITDRTVILTTGDNGQEFVIR